MILPFYLLEYSITQQTPRRHRPILRRSSMSCCCRRWPPTSAGIAVSQRVGAVLPMYFVNLTPVFAACLSWAWLDDPIGVYHLVGGALILAGIYLAAEKDVQQGNSPSYNRDSMRNDQAVTVRRADYRPPDFLLDRVALEFDLDPALTYVHGDARRTAQPDGRRRGTIAARRRRPRSRADRNRRTRVPVTRLPVARRWTDAAAYTVESISAEDRSSASSRRKTPS